MYFLEELDNLEDKDVAKFNEIIHALRSNSNKQAEQKQPAEVFNNLD